MNNNNILRRDFISKTALATTGLFFADGILNTLSAQSIQQNQSPISTGFKLNNDGSFDIISDVVMLKKCYPSIDNQAIKPIYVKVDSNSISYQLTEKRGVKLVFNVTNSGLTIGTILNGFEKAPHWFAPLANAEVINISSFFYQGIGFGGPSGFADLSSEKYKTPVKTEQGSDDNWLLESYLFSGLLNSKGQMLAIGSINYTAFLQKTSLYNSQQRWGLINRHLLNEQILFQVQFSTEEILLDKKELKLPDIQLVANNSAWDAATIMAQNIAKEMQIKPMKEPRYHWCSWYIKQKEFSNQDLTTFIDGLNKQNPKPFIQTIQIDDGYQKYYGDWLDFRTELWGNSIKPSVDLILKNNYKAGIWIGAFMVHKKSQLFKNHPDWILKKMDGNYLEEFGGDCVILDTSNPEAFAYLRNVFRYFKSIGITFYKTDFMDWGLQDSTKVNRYTKGKTSVQYYREVLKMIREEIGQESYWLACISPFAPFLGFADGVRVANDTPENWKDGNLDNVYSQMENLHYANNLLFQNDPDVMYLSNSQFDYSQAEINSFAYFCGIMGGSVNTSEWLNDMKSTKMWRFLRPSGKLEQAILPFWSKNEKLKVVLHRYEKQKAWGLLITNTSSEKTRKSFLINDLINKNSISVFEWNENGSASLGSKTQISINLGIHESALFYLSETNQAPSPIMTLGGWEG